MKYIESILSILTVVLLATGTIMVAVHSESNEESIQQLQNEIAQLQIDSRKHTRITENLLTIMEREMLPKHTSSQAEPQDWRSEVSFTNGTLYVNPRLFEPEFSKMKIVPNSK